MRFTRVFGRIFRWLPRRARDRWWYNQSPTRAAVPLIAVAALAAGCSGNDAGGPIGWTVAPWAGSQGQQQGPAGNGDDSGGGGSGSGSSSGSSSGGGWVSSSGSGSGGSSSGSGSVPQGTGDDAAATWDDAGGSVGSGDDAGGSGWTPDTGGPGPGPGPDATAGAATFTLVFQSALSSCSGCHASAGAAANLDLSSQSTAYANLVGVRASGPSCGSTGEIRVVAGNSSQSLLYSKINGTQNCGNQMLTSGPSDVALVKSWIDNGARND
jgi:hypothetical protein